MAVASVPAAAAQVRVEPGQPWPALAPGDHVVLAPGNYHGPWEIEVPDVSVDAYGAVLHGPPDGSALVLAAPGITLQGLEVRDAGSATDLYAPDAAAWLIGCDGCAVVDLRASNTPTGVRVEASRDVLVERPILTSGPGAPGIDAYDAEGLVVTGARIVGFLDGVYLESSDDVVVQDSIITGAFRYAFHAMFSRGTTLRTSDLAQNNIGSAAMYGRSVHIENNVFRGHVGPLGFGLLLQEVTEATVEGNAFVGNTIGMLIVSVPDVTLRANDVRDGGTGLLVRRTPTSSSSAVRAFDNDFHGNVTDVAIDDPEAAVTLLGNGYETASRLDLDGDGVSDVPHLPSSSFALLMSRQPDLSLYALNPGVLLWETAEVAVPALRLASLQDLAPRFAPRTVASGPAATRTTDAGRPGASPAPSAAAGRWTAVAIALAAAALGAGAARPRRSAW
ncbi:MAG: right-handed parallel beta-helix repeat-containing protein [Trueperaceae bacterium]